MHGFGLKCHAAAAFLASPNKILVKLNWQLWASANGILRAHDIHVPQIVCKDFRLHVIIVAIVVAIVVVVH